MILLLKKWGVMQNKRRYERVPCNLSVAVIAKGETYSAQLENISQGGALVIFPTNLSYGTQLAIQVRFPDRKEDSSLDATVRWFGDGRMGVQFGSLHAIDVHS